MGWEEFFQRYGKHLVVTMLLTRQTEFTIEDLYTMFKDRMLAEMETRNATPHS